MTKNVKPDDILSNKFMMPMIFKDVRYPSAENAFQSTKFADSSTKAYYTRLMPFTAEYRGTRAHATVSNWENQKYDIMYSVLKTKFQNPDAKTALLATGDDDILITNLNHENEWGSCQCLACKSKGRNILGKLLMQLRNELRSNMDR